MRASAALQRPVPCRQQLLRGRSVPPSAAPSGVTKGNLNRLPASKFISDHSKLQAKTAELWRSQKCGGAGTAQRLKPLDATPERFSSPKTGSVGTDRFKEAAVPGTYWNDSLNVGEEVAVTFNTGSKCVTANCRAGDNLLKLAERHGVMIPNRDFCFEGSCCHCEMEVEGGAREVGLRADSTGSDLIRSCICPVPKDRETVVVNVWNDEDIWASNASY